MNEYYIIKKVKCKVCDGVGTKPIYWFGIKLYNRICYRCRGTGNINFTIELETAIIDTLQKNTSNVRNRLQRIVSR